MWRETLLGAAGVVAVAAITPGPNNIAVMTIAGREGLTGAAAAILGVVSGSLVLLLLIGWGAGALLSAEPRLSTAMTLVGCLYIADMGARTIVQSFRPVASQRAHSSLPSGATGLFLFQFVNPKAWMLTITMVSAAQADASERGTLLPLVAVVLVVIPVCLAIWSSLGAAMSKLLRDGPMKSWFDRAMGVLLMASAILLSIGGPLEH